MLLPDVDKNSRLSESATSAIAMLSLRCLFFKPLTLSKSGTVRRCGTNVGQNTRPTSVPEGPPAKFYNGLVSLIAGFSLGCEMCGFGNEIPRIG